MVREINRIKRSLPGARLGTAGEGWLGIKDMKLWKKYDTLESMTLDKYDNYQKKMIEIDKYQFILDNLPKELK